MGFCNSCGRPIVKEDYGTNEDGSLNPEFCKDCFQDGKYTEPDITLNEMIVRKTKETVSELKKVTWPDFAKVVKQTGVVLGVVFVFLVVFLVVFFAEGFFFLK